MKKFLQVTICIVLALSFSSSDARNTRHQLSIESVMNSARAKDTLRSNVQFFFGDKAHARPSKSFGTFTSNKKSRALGRSDEDACRAAFLRAMVSFQDRVLKEGGNAVINLKSYYHENDFSSATHFECGAGGLIAGVTMVGEVVLID